MKKKPNIVMIVSDHQLFRHHDEIKRPCFEAFTETATSFEHACCTTPLCGPVRRTMLTGLYPHNHRNLYNQEPAPFERDTYLEVLDAAGYDNYVFGKWHAGPGTALDHRSKGFSPAEYGNPYITGIYKEYLEKNHLPAPLHVIDTVFANENTAQTFPSLVEGNNAYTCDQYWCGEPCFGKTVTPKETHEAFFLSSLACEKLKDLQHSEKPFHMRIDFWGPHQPYFPTQEYLDLYKDVKIPRYPNFDDNLADKPKTYRHMNKPIADDTGNLVIPSVFPWEEWSRYLKIAYAHSTMVDDAAGQIVNQIKKFGLEEDTIILWTSDHGDALASHGGMFDKGSFMTEETIRIPLAIRVPGYDAKKSDALVHSIDFAPTVLDFAGTHFTDKIDGVSLVPIIVGDKQAVRDSLLLESFGQGYRDRTKVRTLIKGKYKYNFTENDREELYDLSSDPYELRNLAQDSDYRMILDSFYTDCISLMEDYGESDHAFMQRIQ
ncbi:arylsulfatase A family protein [Sphaerochaeta pleomorpha str. Grapes]|uniref:Arylsulfatase A family protein n=1 Tax=Sphaerochaeta pleomorpha (strain ATCC BAA-1885 / DSM 22778 / Grapes) TaxID=158190 RepID=G8QWS2_SPHPG|nr:sulfatase-like hydrolase/transferase [Sphaerochaeta pleomorpha]AEV28366.1 arylsulfatase A family protein [Sphaerochaeta pleomorpha str. Grapes]